MPGHPPTKDWPEWSLILAERELLGAVTAECRKHQARTASTIYPMLDAAGSSTDTLIAIAGQHNIRDGYVITRMIYETLVNCCFIVAGGEAVAERAWRHARQKALRDLDRRIEIAGKEAMQVRWSGADHALSLPANREVIAEFTSKAGREITSWTPENVKERLEVVYSRFGEANIKGMLFGLLLYRHASEIAHGTLYGSLFILGATDPNGPPKSIEALRDYRVDHTRMLLMLTAFALESAIIVIASELGVPALADQAREAQRTFSERRRPDA